MEVVELIETVGKDSPAPVDPMVYRDLLIFEESLRKQYVKLHRRRSKYIVFVSALLLWLAYFFYCVMIAPSQYYYVHLLHRLSLLGGLFTLILYYMSSLLHKTLIYPRKYLGHTNKSLRQFNVKLVPNPPSHRLRNLPLLRWLFRPKSVLSEGGVKIVMNQRGGIEGEFIEGWEMFRADFWDDEERRIKERQEREKKEGRRRSRVMSTGSTRSNSSAKSTGGVKKKKKIGGLTGSVSSVRTNSSNGSVKSAVVKKKKKLVTAEQAVVGL